MISNERYYPTIFLEVRWCKGTGCMMANILNNQSVNLCTGDVKTRTKHCLVSTNSVKGEWSVIEWLSLLFNGISTPFWIFLFRNLLEDLK